ncbi:MAG: Na+/H+ antiporter subunit E [Verrucomicrobiota bacterium]
MADRPKHQTLHLLIIFASLFAVWMIFSGLFDFFHLTLGVISCAVVTWLSSDLFFQNRSHGLAERFRQAIGMIRYSFWLLWQIVVANFHLIRLAFGPREAVQPQIVKFDTNLRSDFEKFLLATSITLTPGTVTIKIVGNTYYVHSISDTAAESLDGEMERRIQAIFSPTVACVPDRSSI